MSIASLDRARMPWNSPLVAIAWSDPRVCRRIATLLQASGFRIRDTGEAAALSVTVCRGAEGARARAVRDVLDKDAGSLVLAVVPGDAANASLRRILLAGAAGIVRENELDSTLIPSARAVLAGQLVVPADLVRQIAPKPLSYREKQILALVVSGMTNNEIAAKLFLAESTVKTHLSSAFRKIDVRSRSEAVSRIQDPDSEYGRGVLELVGTIAPAPRALS